MATMPSATDVGDSRGRRGRAWRVVVRLVPDLGVDRAGMIRRTSTPVSHQVEGQRPRTNRTARTSRRGRRPRARSEPTPRAGDVDDAAGVALSEHPGQEPPGVRRTGLSRLTRRTCSTSSFVSFCTARRFGTAALLTSTSRWRKASHPPPPGSRRRGRPGRFTQRRLAGRGPGSARAPRQAVGPANDEARRWRPVGQAAPPAAPIPDDAPTSTLAPATGTPDRVTRRRLGRGPGLAVPLGRAGEGNP